LLLLKFNREHAEEIIAALESPQRGRGPSAEAASDAGAQYHTLGGLLREIERHCPCGARPESLRTHGTEAGRRGDEQGE